MAKQLYNTEVEFRSYVTGEMDRASTGTVYIDDLHAPEMEKRYGPVAKETENIHVRGVEGERKTYFIPRAPYRRFIGPDGKEYVDLNS